MLTMHYLNVALAFVALQQLPALEGRWEGTFGASRLRLVLHVEKSADGLHFGELVSVDQGGSRIPIERISIVGDSVHLEMNAVPAMFHGRLSADQNRLTGTWMQRRGVPIEFNRVKVTPALASAARPASITSPLGLLMELSTSIAPAPFASGAKSHVAYELHIGNMSLAEMPVSRVEVLDRDQVIADFEGSQLNAIMDPTRAETLDRRTIAPAARATAFLWISFDSGAKVPTQLRHRVSVGTHTITGGVTRVMGPAVVIGPPLRGGDWLALDGPSNAGGHRRVLLPVDGRATIAQRFATDWAKAGPDGALFVGDQRANKAYFSYGAEAIAVTNGVIAATKDGIPENVPGAEDNAVPTTLETASGNYVMIDLGAGRYALYAHLQPGSLRVKVGDRVRRGDVIGLVGNSGNSSGPHLHFHISDSNAPLATEGLPFVIDAWELFRGSGEWERRMNELPLQNARVRFPGG